MMAYNNPNQVAPATFSEFQLVPVFQSEINGRLIWVCDARTLHAFLGNGDKFSDWFKARVDKYEFIENQDFTLISANPEIKIGRGGDRRSKDYHLCLDIAKELSMVENNERGRQARRYFIDMERRALEQMGQVVPPSHLQTLLPAEQELLAKIVRHKIVQLPNAQQAVTEIWSQLYGAFRVNHANQLPRTQLSAAIAYITDMTLQSHSHCSLDSSELTAAISTLTRAIESLPGQLAVRDIQSPKSQQDIPKLQDIAVAFLDAWWQCLGEREMTATDLCRIIQGQQCPVLTQSAAEFFGPVEKLTSRRLGTTFRGWSQRNLGGFCILNKGKTQGGVMWRLERVQ